MPFSGSVLSETLQSITTTKLNELSKRRSVYETQKKALLKVAGGEANQKARIQILANGIKESFGIKTDVVSKNGESGSGRVILGSSGYSSLEIKLRNLDSFLKQAWYDPSVSTKLLQDWEDSLSECLEIQSLKYQYASLYGELVTEWLSAEQGSKAPAVDPGTQAEPDAMDISDEPEDIGETIKQQYRAEWEGLAFEASDIDPDDIEAYLGKLFETESPSKHIHKALSELQESIQVFELSLASAGQFDEDVLRWVIKGLSSSDQLTNEKREVLKDFQNNPVILAEVADVLNMRMKALETWGWEGAIPLEQRRQVSGKYGIYMHEDLLQAMFLQFIGVKWSVHFKQAFTRFSAFDGAWTSLRKPIPNIEKKRREYYLGAQSLKPSIQSKRQAVYKSYYFMSQLLNSISQQIEENDGEEEAELMERQREMEKPKPSMPMKKMKRVRSAIVAPQCYSPCSPEEQTEYDIEPGAATKPKNAMELKQSLLHLLSAEIIINTRLHGEFTCFRSEFDQWGPSLPHETITTVLGFFGVSEKWLDFFRKFLSAPLKFAHDSKSRTLKRGIPRSHVLSNVFSEAVLFCLDFSVNQATDGGQLYRMGEEFWFWSSSHQSCVKAWSATAKFADTMGVSFNENKTGTVRISNDKTQQLPLHPSLPLGDIRWGFLYLDPKTGRFLIDQAAVNKNIASLRLQLASKESSVFSWIQAWNISATTFFVTNFGKSGNAFGRAHVDDVLSTLSRIQKELFRSGSVVEYVKSVLHERFDLTDIPDGYLYFPTELGGLDLKNPFIPLLQIRNAVKADPAASMDAFFLAEAEYYLAAKTNFDKGITLRQRHAVQDTEFKPKEDADTFFSFEEFTKYREEFFELYDGGLYSVFEELLRRPEEESIDFDTGLQHAMNKLSEHGASGEISGNWYCMDPYWKWVVGVYGQDIAERFGGFDIVERGLLPIGMISLFRSGRVQWNG